jgi:heat shock protein HtpX
MWEIIAANQRKSFFIVLGMGILLLGMGYLIGVATIGPEGGILGMGIASAVWIVMTAVSYFQGDSILLSTSRAHEITAEMHPELFNVVEEMKIAAALPKMPRVYVMDEPGLNAFATGTRPDKSSVAVTAGLLSRLDRDELQGVVAHEISHILNRDVLYMTLAGVMLGSMQLVAQVFLRGLWRGTHSMGSAPDSNRRYRSERSSSGGQGQGLMIAAAIIFAVVGPILAQVFYFSLSRKREYLADASGARLTRYPEGLASALEKISGQAQLAGANAVTAPMYIERPNARSLGAVGLFSTHPPIDKRIAILRAMTSAGYAAYAASAKKVLNGDAILPGSAIKEGDTASRVSTTARPVGLGNLQEKLQAQKSQSRAAGDLMRAVNGFIFLTSACGLKLKLPPEYSHPSVDCPKCGEILLVPAHAADRSRRKTQLEPGGQGASGVLPLLDQKPSPSQPMNTAGWRTLACSACTQAMTLSPAFNSPYAFCRHCGAQNPIRSN